VHVDPWAFPRILLDQLEIEIVVEGKAHTVETDKNEIKNENFKNCEQSKVNEQEVIQSDECESKSSDKCETKSILFDKPSSQSDLENALVIDKGIKNVESRSGGFSNLYSKPFRRIYPRADGSLPAVATVAPMQHTKINVDTTDSSIMPYSRKQTKIDDNLTLERNTPRVETANLNNEILLSRPLVQTESKIEVNTFPINTSSRTINPVPSFRDSYNGNYISNHFQSVPQTIPNIQQPVHYTQQQNLVQNNISSLMHTPPQHFVPVTQGLLPVISNNSSLTLPIISQPIHSPMVLASSGISAMNVNNASQINSQSVFCQAGPHTPLHVTQLSSTTVSTNSNNKPSYSSRNACEKPIRVGQHNSNDHSDIKNDTKVYPTCKLEEASIASSSSSATFRCNSSKSTSNSIDESMETSTNVEYSNPMPAISDNDITGPSNNDVITIKISTSPTKKFRLRDFRLSAENPTPNLRSNVPENLSCSLFYDIPGEIDSGNGYLMSPMNVSNNYKESESLSSNSPAHSDCHNINSTPPKIEDCTYDITELIKAYNYDRKIKNIKFIGNSNCKNEILNKGSIKFNKVSNLSKSINGQVARNACKDTSHNNKECIIRVDTVKKKSHTNPKPCLKIDEVNNSSKRKLYKSKEDQTLDNKVEYKKIRVAGVEMYIARSQTNENRNVTSDSRYLKFKNNIKNNAAKSSFSQHNITLPKETSADKSVSQDDTSKEVAQISVSKPKLFELPDDKDAFEELSKYGYIIEKPELSIPNASDKYGGLNLPSYLKGSFLASTKQKMIKTAHKKSPIKDILVKEDESTNLAHKAVNDIVSSRNVRDMPTMVIVSVNGKLFMYGNEGQNTTLISEN